MLPVDRSLNVLSSEYYIPLIVTEYLTSKTASNEESGKRQVGSQERRSQHLRLTARCFVRASVTSRGTPIPDDTTGLVITPETSVDETASRGDLKVRRIFDPDSFPFERSFQFVLHNSIPASGASPRRGDDEPDATASSGGAANNPYRDPLPPCTCSSAPFSAHFAAADYC